MIRYTNMKYGNILILFMLHSNLKSQKGKNLHFNDHSIQKQEVTQGLNCCKVFFFLDSVTFLADMDSLIVDLDKVLDDFEAEGEGLKICFLCHDHVVLLKILCPKNGIKVMQRLRKVKIHIHLQNNGVKLITSIAHTVILLPLLLTPSHHHGY